MFQLPIVPGTPGALGLSVLRLVETGQKQGIGRKQLRNLEEVYAMVNIRKLSSAIQNFVQVR